MNKILTPEILAMYLGQPFTLTDVKEGPAGTEAESWVTYVQPIHINWLAKGYMGVTLHLRTLDSITEGEVREIFGLLSHARVPENRGLKESWWKKFDDFTITAASRFTGVSVIWSHLLSKGFDLFGLIEAGEAIDINSIQVTE